MARWWTTTLLPIAGCVMILVQPASAQVIEIADDGSAQVLGGDVEATTRASVPSAFDMDSSIDEASQRYKVDAQLLRAVAWQESRGHITALSPKGAIGIMQLMPATASQLGVDPRDPRANIHGGAAYLARQISAFGSVPLALAAYNAGPGAVVKYGGVPPYRETRQYVSAIMQRWSAASPKPSLPLVSDNLDKLAGMPLFVIEVPEL